MRKKHSESLHNATPPNQNPRKWYLVNSVQKNYNWPEKRNGQAPEDNQRHFISMNLCTPCHAPTSTLSMGYTVSLHPDRHCQHLGAPYPAINASETRNAATRRFPHTEVLSIGLSSLSLLIGSDFSTGERDSRSLFEVDVPLPQFLTRICLCSMR